MVLIFYVWVGAARRRDRTNEIDEERRSREIREFSEFKEIREALSTVIHKAL